MHGFKEKLTLHGFTKNKTLYGFPKQKIATCYMKKDYKVLKKKASAWLYKTEDINLLQQKEIVHCFKK